MSEQKPREFWIFKGTSNHCSELNWDFDTDKMVKCRPDEFYDIVSTKDTIEGGIHVIEYSAYQALEKENYRLKSEIEELDKSTSDLYVEQKERYKARLDKLGTALDVADSKLKEILNEGNMAAQGHWDATDKMKVTAYEALAEITKIKGDK